MTATSAKPLLVILAGPNGAGKSTAAPFLLRDVFEVGEFVNADTIAAGLSAFRPESVAIAAGRLMLQRMRRLASRRADFAFETTLASRTFAPWLVRLRDEGYHAHLLFLALDSPDSAVTRVAARVRQGGHDVPESIVRRRFSAGLYNFFERYQPIVDTWQVFDNSDGQGRPRLIARGRTPLIETVRDHDRWEQISDRYS